MKIVYSWLKDFVDIHVPVEELAEALTSAGLEVASIQKFRIPSGIIVARVLQTERHPNADRLSICKVDPGTPEPLTIVCGAPNVRPGIVTALATTGTVLGPDFTVKKAKIRGVESSGMLCSEKELGISDNHSGIMELPEDFKAGKELSVYFPDDEIIEIEITPDRGDCLSMIGVAREVSARFGLPLKNTAQRPLTDSSDPLKEAISVSIEAPEACPRYTGRLIRGVKIAPSPEWMQRRLSLAGIRPINNVVDITNYILLHFGQPMHAFDYSNLQDKKIIVKKAGSELVFSTLDNIERKLISEDLLINDGKRPVALAGIMGGAGSEIKDDTTEVFLECAFFDPIAVRKTSKRLGLSTDSSYRFERGVDPDQILLDALDTAAELIRELSGGVVADGRIDEYPVKFTPREIVVRPQKASMVLGIPFTAEQIISFLSSLQMECVREPSDAIRCKVPLFRHDLTIEVDLIEEIGRMYGYDNIPPTDTTQVLLNQGLPVTESTTDKIRSALIFFGLNEVMTNSMTSEQQRILLTPEKNPVKLLNPLSPEMAQMRTTLAGSMLDVVAYNLNHKNLNNHLFELGKVFEEINSDDIKEKNVIGIVIEGNYWNDSWNTKALPCDFYILKGVLDTFAANAGIGFFTFSAVSEFSDIFEEEVALVKSGLIQGIAGKVSEKACKHYDIKSSVYYAELDITALLKTSLPQPEYKALPRFPALERDFSFVMPDELSASDITKEIYGISALIEEVVPFDLFRGEKLGPGRKSITFSVKIRSPEKTLTDKDAEEICSNIVTVAQSKFGAQLRT